jgi:hypothetical protein
VETRQLTPERIQRLAAMLGERKAGSRDKR